MTTSYKCPLCNKSIVKMDALFMNLANIIKEQPMPEEFQDVRSVILCNDCSAKCSTPFHFLGLRCQICQSFNTVELDRSPMPGSRPEDQQDSAQVDSSEPQTSSHTNDGADIDSSLGLVSTSPDAARAVTSAVQSNGTPSRNFRFVEPELDLDNEDEEDEELDFWGGDARSGASESEDGDDDASDDLDESEIDEEEEDDDDDNGDEDIILFGHR